MKRVIIFLFFSSTIQILFSDTLPIMITSDKQNSVIYIDNNKLPGANFTWIKNGQAKITADLGKEQGIALQIPYNSL